MQKSKVVQYTRGTRGAQYGITYTRTLAYSTMKFDLHVQFSLSSLDNFYNLDLFFLNLHVFRRAFLVTFTGLTFSISV